MESSTRWENRLKLCVYRILFTIFQLCLQHSHEKGLYQQRKLDVIHMWMIYSIYDFLRDMDMDSIINFLPNRVNGRLNLVPTNFISASKFERLPRCRLELQLGNAVNTRWENNLKIMWLWLDYIPLLNFPNLVLNFLITLWKISPSLKKYFDTSRTALYQLTEMC